MIERLGNSADPGEPAKMSLGQRSDVEALRGPKLVLRG